MRVHVDNTHTHTDSTVVSPRLQAVSDFVLSLKLYAQSKSYICKFLW